MYQLDLHSRAPIYQQLKEKILRLIMAGAIGPGDPLPSVRVMARELGINPNTVAKAYQDLEKKRSDLFRSRQGQFYQRGGNPGPAGCSFSAGSSSGSDPGSPQFGGRPSDRSDPDR